MYTDRAIYGLNLEQYKAYIPPLYQEGVKNGELIAAATHTGEEKDSPLIGVHVTARRKEWLEIMWISMGEPDVEDIYVADYLRYVIRQAEKTGKYIGVFTEVGRDDCPVLSNRVLAACGMNLKKTKSCALEFCLADVTGAKQMMALSEQADCVFLEDAKSKTLDKILERMFFDERWIPVPQYVMWDDYEGRLSNVYLEKNEPKGIFLVSEHADHLVVNLCYGAAKAAVPAMIGCAMRKALKLYPKEQKVMVPVVAQNVWTIISKMVPGVEREEIFQAVKWFDKRELPASMQQVMDLMTNDTKSE